MNIATKTCVIAFAVVCFLGMQSVDAGNGWGWAKPLNKKVGSPFYTSNKNINNSYGFRSKAWKQANLPSSYSQRASNQHANIQRAISRPAKVVRSVPTPVVTAKPVVIAEPAVAAPIPALPPAPTAAVKIVTPQKTLVPMRSVSAAQVPVPTSKPVSQADVVDKTLQNWLGN